METDVRFVILKRELFANGMSFGNTGPYERLLGRIFFSTDPDNPAQKGVVDLDKAPRNPEGRVEFSADFHILKPIEMARGNHRLLYEVVNRGNTRILRTFNDAQDTNEPCTTSHAGNGFLMRRGYTLVWSGWQGDILPGDGRMTIDVPIATEEGKEIIGKVGMEFIANDPDVFSFPLRRENFSRSYEAATTDTSQSVFTCREYERDSRIPIPPDQWQFAHAQKDPLSGQWRSIPSTTDCFLSSGFRPGWIYELIFPAKNPRVMGLGFVAVRELISFLRYTNTDVTGTPNPLKENGIAIEKSYAWGISQSGFFLHEFIYRGFNETEKGRWVFEGIFPQSAGSCRVMLNYRFARPGRFSCQHEDHPCPSNLFPFSYASITDPLTGKTDALLKRPKTDPLVIDVQVPVDYWQLRASLVHTDSEGKDLILPDNVRVYLLASTSTHPLKPEEEKICKYPPHIHLPFVNAVSRALLDLLNLWVSTGSPPPRSRIPSIADGTLVSTADVRARFPLISGVACPGEPNRLQLLDYGPEIERGIINQYPPCPIERKEYAVLVPQVDSDGNDIPGIGAPDIVAPLATYTGWNFRREGFSPNALAILMGSYFPFARTAAEREENGDPRPSIEERYRSLAGYVRAVARATERLVAEGFLLEEDADRYIETAMRCKLFPASTEEAI